MKVNGLTKVNVIGCYACTIEAVKPCGSTAEKRRSSLRPVLFFPPHNSAPPFIPLWLVKSLLQTQSMTF